MNLAHRPSPDSTSLARMVWRVRFRATRVRRPSGVGVDRESAAGSITRLDLQVLHDQDDRGPKDDDEQRREDAPDEREEHLDRRFRRHLLRSLAALDPELLRLDLEDLADRDAELLGLDDRADEVGQRRDLGPRDDVAERLAAGLPNADFGKRPAELLGQWALELLDDLAERRIEAETRPHGDGQEVERVRDLEKDQMLALLDPAAEPELGDRVAEHQPDGAHQDPENRRQAHEAHDAEQEDEQDSTDDRGNSLD